MEKKLASSWDWVRDLNVQMPLAQNLLDCLQETKPVWTPELDAAVRIIFVAVNGSLADRKTNESYTKTIKTLLNKKQLCNSDLFDFAVEILSNPYFHPPTNGIFDKSHCHIVTAAKQIWDKKNSQAMAACG